MTWITGLWFLPLKTPSPSYSGSNSSPAWVMSLGPSALVPVNKPHVIAARTGSRELLGKARVILRLEWESPYTGGLSVWSRKKSGVRLFDHFTRSCDCEDSSRYPAEVSTTPSLYQLLDVAFVFLSRATALWFWVTLWTNCLPFIVKVCDCTFQNYHIIHNVTWDRGMLGSRPIWDSWELIPS